MADEQLHKSPLHEYVHLLSALYSLMVNGQGESDEADEIREASERPWKKLSREDRRRANWLSEDLYSLESILSPGKLSLKEFPSSSASRLVQAASLGQYDELLSLLRQYAAKLPPDRVACLRAYVWMLAEQSAPAQLFLRGAAHAALYECAKALDAPPRELQLISRRQRVLPKLHPPETALCHRPS